MDFCHFIQEFIPEEPAFPWQGTTIDKVEVFSKQRLWKLHLTSPVLVKADLIDHLTDRLNRSGSLLPRIELAVQPQEHSRSVAAAIHTDLKNLLAGEYHHYADVDWSIERNLIELYADRPEQYEMMLTDQICNWLSEWFWQTYRLRMVVRARLRLAEPTGAVAFLPTKPTEPGLMDVVIEKKVPYKGKKKHGKLKPLSLTDGDCTPLADVEEGNKVTLVEGEIWDNKIHMLRDGNYIITYFITDGYDSLAVKYFCDHLQTDDLAIGDFVCFRGNVRYDQGAREIVLMADGYLKREKRLRQDLASEKRVELHAHTKMSAMDGLTEVEDLIQCAAQWGHAGLAITDHGCIQAFPDAYKFAKKYNIKILYGIEAYMVIHDKKEKPYHIILLAQNVEGLKNLYQLISISYLNNFYRFPKLTKEDIIRHRNGLLLGSACEAGELFSALLEQKPEEELLAIASFYDYLEIQPTTNNEFLLRSGTVHSEEQLQALVRKIIGLGQKLHKPVVATGDVHFLEPHHEIFRKIIQSGQGYDDIEGQAPLYLKTTEEMLEAFSFLEPEIREQVVVKAPNHICALIENIKPVPDGFYPPQIDSAEEELIQLTREKAYELYGPSLPVLVEERITREINAITKHGFSVLYIVAHKLVKKSNEDGYLVGSRGSVGSSLVAYLTGITEVNPLIPHYRCSNCFYCEFSDRGISVCGVDLPDKNCPHCGQKLRKDGFDIPFETFLGFAGDKVPDIDLNFSGDYQSRAHQYVEEIFGKENVFRAGTISTIADKKAYGFVKKYEEEQNLNLKYSEINRLVKGISGVRKTTGQHPGGLIVLPQDHHINEFTPLQHPADNKDSGIITTHFEYHALEDQLVKLDILGHDDPTVLRSLEELTGVRAADINLSDKKTMQIFSCVEPLGIQVKDIDSKVGTLGIPEFGTRFVRQMLEATMPTSFSELVRISGLSHGTDVWVNNAQDLINSRTATLNEVICTRDDIMTYLIQQGVEKKLAFKIMEQVRKGKGLKTDEVQVLEAANIPAWYIDSCQKIKYMFPKAHAVAYVTMAFRIAYFKVYYPLEFYASFFSVRAEDFDAKTIVQGYDAVKMRIKNIEKSGLNASPKDRKLLPILEVALEMWARGFRFYPVDIYKSQAHTFLIEEQGLLLPFSALPNVGLSAAQGIVEGRGDKHFVSIEDFQQKTRLNKTSMEILRENHCFKDLPESNQISLFG